MKSFFSYQFEDILVLQTPSLWETYQGYNYMLAKSGEAWIFDPGEFEPIEKTLQSHSLTPQAIYLTHHHQDHVGATTELVRKYNCPVFGFEDDSRRLPSVNQHFKAGDELLIADHLARILFLPGHTTGLCAFYFSDLNLLFSNDLLFSLGCGRVFEGTYQQMFDSLERVRNLPPKTFIFPSHEYTEQNLNFGLSLFPDDENLNNVAQGIIIRRQAELPTVPTSLEFEKENNPFLRWDDPSIRKKLEMTDATDLEVFSEIRNLKDNH